jgi:hypothetical protein
MRQGLSTPETGGVAAQVPLFQTAVVDGERTVTGIEPVFSSRLNSGNTFLVVIEVTVHQQWMSCGCARLF